MSLERLVQRLESRLVIWGRRFFVDPREEKVEQLAELEAEVVRQRTLLEQKQKLHEETQQRVQSSRKRVQELSKLIAESVERENHAQALLLAFELDSLRRKAEEDATLLPQLEQTCWSLEFKLRQLHRQHEQLQEELNKPDPGRSPSASAPPTSAPPTSGPPRKRL